LKQRSRGRNAAASISGRRKGNRVAEREHFYICDECGQSVDKRDLGEVFHHEEPGHEGPPDDA
jgi:hypothetical protein